MDSTLGTSYYPLDSDLPPRSDILGRMIEGIFPAFQPIVQWSTRSVVGWEALVRSVCAGFASAGGHAVARGAPRPHPRGGARHEGGRGPQARRRRSGRAHLPQHPPDELGEAGVLSEADPLRALAPKVVLELTERSKLGKVEALDQIVARLRAHGCRIALDDVGGGYGSLALMTRVTPDVCKLDIRSLRGERSPAARRAMVRALREIADDLGAALIVQGVETEGERDELVSMGCDLFEGYLFGRPRRSFGLDGPSSTHRSL
jgi:EAL domain-containing protein (putative c-di-GMP-specific phosphodiesterase class I)